MGKKAYNLNSGKYGGVANCGKVARSDMTNDRHKHIGGVLIKMSVYVTHFLNIKLGLVVRNIGIIMTVVIMRVKIISIILINDCRLVIVSIIITHV